jgi:class 3 adenylate cyclase
VADRPTDKPDYRPEPLDTSGVELGPELRELTERLAEHAHDLWARLRMAQGWEYGPERDDVARRHPCLIPYGDLPESEKDHDRNTAMGTIRAVLALGYRLAAPSPESLVAAPRGDSDLAELMARLARDEGLDLDTLRAMWQAHSPQHWALFPQLFALLGQRLLACGSPLLAYDVLAEGLAARPRDVRLRQLSAHALARAGAPAKANALMRELYQEGHRDEETLGILGRTHKDLALVARTTAERSRNLELAFQHYGEGFSLSGGSYTGINAATMALLLGRKDDMRELARRARAAALTELAEQERAGSDRYWRLATLAEAALILDENGEAERLYREATHAAGARHGDQASTRRNARLILSATGRPSERIDELLPIPRVVVFTGTMIDRPDRGAPRFPLAAESAVARALDERLATLDAGFGYASGACGGDILILEAMARRGGKTSIVLPYPEGDFLADSVTCGIDSDWATRFDTVIQHAGTVLRAVGQRFTESPVFYQYANMLLLGLARIQSEMLGVDLVPLALWDGEPGEGAGGTAATVAEWRTLGYQVEVIDLKSLVSSVSKPVAVRNPANIPVREDIALETRIMAVLFADVVNFSKLTEVEIPRFVEHFLGAVGRLVRESSQAPIVSNTWGDGLYFVFRNVADAGEWALDLCETAASTDWSRLGLRKDLNLRVALHAGPLFTCIDPVTGQRNFTGKQVVPAARLEPVTPPGLVYASQEFAALAAATQARRFTCQPVGRIGLAKGAGNVPVYHVSRVPR